MTGEITEHELFDNFAEQATALERGGADACCIESMMAIDEAVTAVRAVRENTSLEILCTFTFEKTVQGTYRTMMGSAPCEAALAAVEAGADVIGSNCGRGITGMIDIVKEMRTVATDRPIIVNANAGMPVRQDGQDVFPETPEQMAELVPTLIAAGANIIGGCCGTTPAHIAAVAGAVTKLEN
jgi:5-methyltetrahydrofolate--homocysteine methyltransferase